MTNGPFEVTPDRIVRLGASFTEFVNRLLTKEAAALGVPGKDLVTTFNENAKDKGVDATTDLGGSSNWIPLGKTAWQFKRSAFSEQQCVDEFAKATFAHAILAAGGSYIITIGADLPAANLDERQVAIFKRAVELQLVKADGSSRIQVLGASHLARWASRFVALAMDPILQGPGSDAVNFDTWSRGQTFLDVWVPDDRRQALMTSLREELRKPGTAELRIQGDSGIGKTRLAIETLREAGLQELVAYVHSEDAVHGALLAYLMEEDRAAILVVDECPPERHIKLVERLLSGSPIKLITIGPGGAAVSKAPVSRVDEMPDDKLEEFLKTNYEELPSEARRFVVDHSRGNMRWSIALADRIALIGGSAQAADLIARNDIETFIVELLPEGRSFFYAAILALLERVGWDRDLRPQVECLATFAGISVEEMVAVGLDLEDRGLLTRQGRYRSVSPHPLAVFLAAEAWRLESHRIMEELLPALDEEMSLNLFLRVAQLGRFEPARSVLPQLLSAGGPFATLDSIEAGSGGRKLTQLAIVLPEEVATHLSELIEGRALDALRTLTSSRRDLVWTLEKLVWHRSTFRRSADALLRLALAENETWSNNATGTWLDLFGTFLPGTAARPSERSAYLVDVAGRSDAATLALVVQAAGNCLQGHSESITVSGELQGGVLVEPRGGPKTWDEVAEYRRAALGVLQSLASVNDSTVAQAAVKTLLDAIHPLIDDSLVGPDLERALLETPAVTSDRVRLTVEKLLALFDRVERDHDAIVAALESLLRKLPAPAPEEELRVSVQLNRWDLADGELETRISRALSRLDPSAVASEVSAVLAEEVPGAWELGHALASGPMSHDEAIAVTMDTFDVNSLALVGLLSGFVDAGTESAFDEFLSSGAASGLSEAQKVSIAVRGPVTHESRSRIINSLHDLPVAEGIFAIFGWQRNLTETETLTLLDSWQSRVESQRDYNALVDWLSMRLHGVAAEDLSPDIVERAAAIVEMRRSYPEVGQEEWDWSRITGLLPATQATRIATVILDILEGDGGFAVRHEGAGGLLRKVAEADPDGTWALVADRLTSDSWRLQMALRGWFLGSIPVDTLREWVGEDLSRARKVAGLAAVGGDEPSPIVRYLLGEFGDDDKVAGSLYGDFTSGMWTGNESDRLSRQIDQLKGWRANLEEPLGVRQWAAKLLPGLEQQRIDALEREAERGF